MKNKVILHILDTRKYTYNDLLSLTMLNEEELSLFDKYHVLSVKKEKLVSYYFKKKYVGDYFLNEFGKPLSNNIYFNISDSKGIVVIALSKENDVGVDIEILKPKDEDLVKYVCNDEEYKYVKNEVDFLSIWTNKESLVKCVGTGIKNNIKSIPSLPINGKKEYNENIYYSKSVKYNDSIISITLKGENEFDYELIVEDNKWTRNHY